MPPRGDLVRMRVSCRSMVCPSPSFTKVFQSPPGSDIFRFLYILRGGYLILLKAVFSTDVYLGFAQGEFLVQPVAASSTADSVGGIAPGNARTTPRPPKHFVARVVAWLNYGAGRLQAGYTSKASPVFIKSRPSPPAPNFLPERSTAAG